MYTLLNIIVFTFLSGYALKLMFSTPSYVKLSRTEKVLLTGREKFLLLTMVTGMVQVGGFSVGVDLSALRLMVWMMMILLAYVVYRKSPNINVIVLIYFLFLTWMSISLMWTDEISFGIRVILKYLYPFLIMIFAFNFIRSTDFIFVAMRWLIITSFVLSLSLGGITERFAGFVFDFGGVFWPSSTFADFLAIMSGISYLMWWRTKDRKYLYLIGWFLLSSLSVSIRTGLLGLFVVFIVASYLRYRVYSLPYVFAILFVAVLSVFFVPSVKEKMFFAPEQVTSINDVGSVSTDQINSNGRFAMWEWSLNKFYAENKLIGSGVGTLQETFYSGRHPFSHIKIIHNDYVQILSDIGLIGLSLYILFVLVSAVSAMKYIQKNVPVYLQNVSFLVITSFAATLTTMMTDNVVNYAFAVHAYPFMFLGILLAYRNIYKSELKTSRTEGTQ